MIYSSAFIPPDIVFLVLETTQCHCLFLLAVKSPISICKIKIHLKKPKNTFSWYLLNPTY